MWEGGDEDDGEEGMQGYVCPVYLHTHAWNEHMGQNTDVDDCLFELLLPPGRFSPAHWVTRNVVLLVTSDPSQLVGLSGAKG